MGLDQYKVDVLHYLNPHLIWVLVKTDKESFHFEQIGIYGILPQNVTFGVDCVIKAERCEEWKPAAAVAMVRSMMEAAEVQFSPTYIDKKTSIFDDNTHKYGDLIIIKKNGQQISLQDEIVKSEFAFEDECLFHQELRDNKLETNLSYVTIHEVMHKIEEGYKTRGISKKVWLEALKNQTSVLEEAKHLETSIKSRKHGVKNYDNIDTLLQNKLNVLKLCKDVDEVSVGRACSLRESRPSSIVNVALKKKLEWLKAQSIENRPKLSAPKIKDTFEDKQNNNDIGTNNNNNFAEEENNVDFRKGKKPRKTIINRDTNYVAFGPAGLPPNKFSIKPKKTEDQEDPPVVQVKRTPEPIHDEVKKPEDVYASTDSEVNLKISNLDLLNRIKSLHTKHNNTSANKIKTKIEALNAIKRKIKYLEEKQSKIINDSLSSFSDRDSSKCGFDSDNESLAALEKELASQNNTTKKNVDTKIQAENFDIDVKVSNVNPFKNLDGSLSVFVEKLISPVIMGHTKKDNRIQPVSNMRDIPFGVDIHNVLRNMSVQKPMRPQTVSWPTILRGHSFFLIGPHNSGNTMGYLPAVCRLVYDFKNSHDRFGLSCIIVCGTSRAVCAVESDCKMFLHSAKIFACYAGMSDIDITTSLLNGCDLLICTPTMLVRLIQEDFSLDFRSLSTFVVDDCEHISKIYPKELKFCLLSVMDIVKNRAHKEWKVQFVIVSRLWCDFMSSLARKAPDSVICISAFEECVLYSKAATSVEFLAEDKKLDTVIKFLADIDKSKKSVIVCRADDEVKLIEKALIKLKYVVFSCDSNMTVHDLYNLDKTLKDYEEPVLGPVLVCCDGNLSHLNVTDAHYLIHYSLPDLFSMFCKRFAVLIDNYASVFKDVETNIKIKILLDDNNIEQLPKILNFIKRCTQDVPPFLNEISSTVLNEKYLKKAQNLVPICRKLMTLGKCPDYWNCIERHAIFEQYDSPKSWIPKQGVITFQILHYHSAVYYSARISTCITQSNTIKYPQTYSLLSFKMGMYYSKEENRKLHDMPKVGDVCAVTLKQNLFVRCQVAKVLRTENRQPTRLLIKLIDEERYEVARDTWLYYLPDDLKNIETHVVTVILANLAPQDKDVTFSNLAEYRLKKITEQNDDLYMRGQITMVVSNTIFVDTLEACQNLSSLNEVVVKCDFRKELLDGHAIPNPDHIRNLRKVSDFTSDESIEEIPSVEVTNPIKELPKGSWAHLESGRFSSVFFMYADNPCQFFVRPVKFEKCLVTLIKDIKKYVADNPEPLETINAGDIVLAEFPDDVTYERARIDEIVSKDKVKCFFVDQGEWRDVSVMKVLPITETIITQLPFQAIECRLIGIKPLGDNWSEFSTHLFVDNCFDSVDRHKQLFTKFFTKEKAKFTEGHKYGVVLIDTYSEEDVIINQMMIDKNLAEENDEIHYLNDLGFERKSEESSDSDDDDLRNPVDKIDRSILFDDKTKDLEPTKKSSNLIRSVPLVDSDDDEFDFMPDETGKIGAIPISEVVSIKELPDTEWDDKIVASAIDDSERPVEHPKQIIPSDQASKPKLLWRQNKNIVTIHIKLIVEDYDIVIKERSLKFSANTNNTDYAFNFELYGVVDLKKCIHCNKGQYIQVKLWKVMASNWLSLTRESENKKWIVYDIDSIDVSSDEEPSYLDDRKNFIDHYVDSDTDDNFEDDVSFSY